MSMVVISDLCGLLCRVLGVSVGLRLLVRCRLW